MASSGGDGLLAVQGARSSSLADIVLNSVLGSPGWLIVLVLG